MKYFHYNIKGNEILGMAREVQEIPPGFIEYKVNMEGSNIYYRLRDGELAEAIGEAMHEDAAHRRVNEFLSGFNASLV